MRQGLLVIVGTVTLLTLSCKERAVKMEFHARELSVLVGGKPAIVLERSLPQSPNQAVLSRVVLLPGRGMNIYQVRAYLPGLGEVDLFTAPPVEEAPKLLNGGPEDFYGNKSFTVGGAILIPYANRIRGRFLEKERAIETRIGDRIMRLPANWKGKRPEAEPHAMHGLILDQPFQNVQLSSDVTSAAVKAELHAGNFRGHWPSQTHLTFEGKLDAGGFEFSVSAMNVGDQPLPIGIGWHPYFEFPSKDRRQARLRIPARSRALVNNYDDVFPTGDVVPVKGTPYDFSGPEGAPLGELFLDDCFLELERDAQGRAVAEVIDPKANYRMKIIALSPDIRAFQVYAPVEKTFAAVEPQFNLADPFSAIWKGRDTGMVTLQPGQSVTYRVRLEVAPAK